MAAEGNQQTTEIESIENFAEMYPVLYEEILTGGRIEGLAEGKNQERALFAELKEACGDDHELLVQCFSESKTAAEAMKLLAAKLGKKNTALTEKVSDLQKEKPRVEAAQVEFSDQATPPGGGGDNESGDADEETLKKEFAAMSADERAEFGEVESYVAFKQADGDGRVRIAHQNN